MYIIRAVLCVALLIIVCAADARQIRFLPNFTDIYIKTSRGILKMAEKSNKKPTNPAANKNNGKGEKKHLKLLLAGGKHKWPAMFWNAAERLGKDLTLGDTIDVVYRLERNLFNGMETAQMIVQEAERSR